MELATVVILVREEGSAEKGGRGGGRSHVQNRRRQKVRELHIVVKLLLLKILNFLAKIVKILLQKINILLQQLQILLQKVKILLQTFEQQKILVSKYTAYILLLSLFNF